MRIVFTSINQGRQVFDPRGPVGGITFPMNCRGKIIPFPSDISRFSRDTIWLVSFMEYDLGYIDLEEKTLQPLDNPFGPKL